MTHQRRASAAARPFTIAITTALLALAGCTEPRAFSDESAAASLIVPPLTPPIAVAKIEGAPHDWEIQERVAKALRAHDIPASTGAVEKSAYVLKGEFIQTPRQNGDIDVRVTWRLFDTQQRQVAETSHRATLAKALLQQSAAEVADGLARVTAERLAPLLPSDAPRPEPAIDASAAPRPLERPPELESLLQFQRAEEPSTRSDVEIGGKQPVRAARQHYWVQIGSHKDEVQGRAEWPKLQAAGGDALRDAPHRIVRADLGAKGVFYRIQVGPYGAPADAAALCAQLKARNLDCFLAIEAAVARPEPVRPEPPKPAAVAKPEKPAPAARPEAIATPAPSRPETKPTPAPAAKSETKPEPATAPVPPKVEPKPETKPAPAVAKPAERPRIVGAKPPVFKRPEIQPPAANTGEPLLPEKPSTTRDDAPTSTAPGLPGVID